MLKIKDEKGITFILVLVAMIIFSVTFIAVTAGSRTQTNITGMTRETTNALSHAEKGLTLALAKLDNGESIGSGFTYADNDGWTVTLKMTAIDTKGNYMLESKAAKGRYSRTVAMNVSIPKGGSPIAADYACFTGGDLRTNNGNNGWLNLNREKFFANGNLDIGIGLDFGGDAGRLMAHGSAEARKAQEKDKVKVTGDQNPIDFPELDFDALTQGHPTCTPSQLKNAIMNLENKGGGTLVVKVNGPEVALDYNININKEVTLVFVKAEGYTGDYNIHFKGDSWNINGKLNLLADGGWYHFNSFSLSSNGVIYTNYDPGDGKYSIHVNNSGKSFNPGAILVKGSFYLNNANYNVKNDPQSYWKFLEEYWKDSSKKVTASNWREL